MHRAFYYAGWGYVLVCGALLARHLGYLGPVGGVDFSPGYATYDGSDAARWFSAVKPACNALEVDLRLRTLPPPPGAVGAGYGAACLAVAGRIDAAHAMIMALPEKQRQQAAGIVFEIGHPIADAGDDRSAGPIMKLVVEFQPWNYMALYHAGMSYYVIGQHEEARRHLLAFLRTYDTKDGWRSNAVTVLRRLGEEVE